MADATCQSLAKVTREPRPPLTFEQVHIARTSGLTDIHLARKWRVCPQTVSDARMGRTHKGHPTKPDTRPRKPGGRLAGPKALRAPRSDSKPEHVHGAG